MGETGQAPELPDEAVILRAICDPGSFTKRSDHNEESYGESIHHWAMRAVRQVITEWLADRTVVQLPEPDETYTDSILRARWSLCTAIVGGRGPKVNVLGGPYLDPDVAESRGAELIAAARLARRLASESSGDGEPGVE